MYTLSNYLSWRLSTSPLLYMDRFTWTQPQKRICRLIVVLIASVTPEQTYRGTCTHRCWCLWAEKTEVSLVSLFKVNRQRETVYFGEFPEDCFCHITSSPHYPKSNGEDKRAMKSAKEILRLKYHYHASLTYWGTLLSSLVPSFRMNLAEIAYRRKRRTTLPNLPQTFIPHAVDPDIVRMCDNSAKAWQKKYHDQRAEPFLDLSHLTFEVTL